MTATTTAQDPYTVVDGTMTVATKAEAALGNAMNSAAGDLRRALLELQSYTTDALSAMDQGYNASTAEWIGSRGNKVTVAFEKFQALSNVAGSVFPTPAPLTAAYGEKDIYFAVAATS